MRWQKCPTSSTQLALSGAWGIGGTAVPSKVLPKEAEGYNKGFPDATGRLTMRCSTALQEV